MNFDTTKFCSVVRYRRAQIFSVNSDAGIFLHIIIVFIFIALCIITNTNMFVGGDYRNSCNRAIQVHTEAFRN